MLTLRELNSYRRKHSAYWEERALKQILLRLFAILAALERHRLFISDLGLDNLVLQPGVLPRFYQLRLADLTSVQHADELDASAFLSENLTQSVLFREF